MTISRADWSALFTGATNFPAELYQDSVRIHKSLYWTGVLSLVALTTLCVVLSYMGMTSVIAIINIALMLILGFYATTPAAFIGVFSAGAAAKLGSYNWTWRNIFADEAFVFPDIQLSEAAKQGWKAYLAALKLPAHFLLVAITAGTVLALFRVEHPSYALVFFPTLAAIGLWAFVHTSGAVWYRRITIAILVIGALVSFYQAFGGDKIVKDVTYSKTLQVEITSLRGTRVCCVEPGTRTFTAPKRIPVVVGGTNRDLEEWILVNGAVAGESFAVNKDGYVEVSFAMVSGDKAMPISPQIIPLKFK